MLWLRYIGKKDLRCFDPFERRSRGNALARYVVYEMVTTRLDTFLLFRRRDE